MHNVPLKAKYIRYPMQYPSQWVEWENIGILQDSKLLGEKREKEKKCFLFPERRMHQ